MYVHVSYFNITCKQLILQQVRVSNEFPGYIVDSIEGYLEASHKFTVLDVIGSFMNSERYPPPSLLHTITQNLLLVSATSWSQFFCNLSNIMHLLLPHKTRDLRFRVSRAFPLSPASDTRPGLGFILKLR